MEKISLDNEIKLSILNKALNTLPKISLIENEVINALHPLLPD